MLDLKVGRDAHGHTVILGSPSKTIAPAELNVSLSWATPHTIWPQNMGANHHQREKLHHHHQHTRVVGSEEFRGIRKMHPSHAYNNNIIPRSNVSVHGEHHVTGSNKEDSLGVHPNVAIAFESLYGRMYLLNVLCPRVEALLAVGAYSQRWVFFIFIILNFFFLIIFLIIFFPPHS